MRIAINAALLGSRHSGVGRHIAGLAHSLARQGHEVVVYGSSPFIPCVAGVKLEATPRWIAFDAGRYSGLLRMLWNVFVLPIRVLGKQFDALVSHNAEGTVWGPLPQMLVVHDLIPLFYPNEAPRLSSYYRRFLPLALKHSSAVVAVSQHTRDDLLQHYRLDPGVVHVAYNGVEETSVNSHPGPPASLPSGPYFLFVGTFSPRKNLQTVLRAFARVQDRVRESLLIIAYPDRWMSDCFRLAEELGIRDRITHMHGLADGEMTCAYERSTAVYLLSEYEGFGFPPLEAMLAGTPAVVSDSTALGEVVGDAAIKIGTHDIVAASESMLRLSTDSAYRESHRQLGQQRASTFTWAGTASKIAVILSGMVQSRDGKSQLTKAPQ